MKVELWNHLGEENSNLHLDARELYLYYFVSSLKRRDYVSVVSIDMLQDYLPVKFVKTKKDNKNIIRELLDRLIHKKLISITYDGNNIEHISQVDNKSLLYIAINGDFKKGKIDDFNGYESISLKKVCSFEKIEYLYIYYVIAKYKNKCVVASSRWANKLGVGETKAKELINEMVSKVIIYVNAGDYSNDNVNDGQKLQNPNQYSLTPFKDNEKSHMQKKNENHEPEVVEDVEDDDEKESNPIQEAIKSFQTYDNHFPNKYDYYQYLLVKDNPNTKEKKQLVKVAEKRMRNLKHNQMVKDNLDAAEQEIIKELDKKYQERAQEILNDSDDVALLIDGEVVAYNEWNKVKKVKRVYYRFGKYHSIVDGLIEETRFSDISNNDDVELHRPDENGEWDNEHKQYQREMEMDTSKWSVSPY